MNTTIPINRIHLFKLQPCKNKILFKFMEINTLANVFPLHLSWAAFVGWGELAWDCISHSTDSGQSLDFQAFQIKGD